MMCVNISQSGASEPSTVWRHPCFPFAGLRGLSLQIRIVFRSLVELPSEMSMSTNRIESLTVDIFDAPIRTGTNSNAIMYQTIELLSFVKVSRNNIDLRHSAFQNQTQLTRLFTISFVLLLSLYTTSAHPQSSPLLHFQSFQLRIQTPKCPPSGPQPPLRQTHPISFACNQICLHDPVYRDFVSDGEIWPRWLLCRNRRKIPRDG